MKIALPILLVILLVAAAGWAVAIKRPTHDASEEQAVTITLPIGTAAAAARLQRVFAPAYDAPSAAGKSALLPEKYRHFVIVAATHDLFPSMEALRSDPAVGVRRYASLPPRNRDSDVALLRDPTFFWAVPEHPAGADYGCSFILHMTSLAREATRLDVLAFDCIERHGRTLTIGHSGLGFYPNYRKIGALSEESRSLADLLASSFK
jgi:hypothetical protein